MAINIPLIDGWRILSDTHNIILAREDDTRIKSESFHNTIEGAVQSFLDKKIKGFDCKSIHSLLLAIKDLQTRLNTTLHPLDLKVMSIKEEKE